MNKRLLTDTLPYVVCLLLIVLVVILATSCASKHAYQARYVDNTVSDKNECKNHPGQVCELGWRWDPAQLTPAGCAVHTLVTGGHIAWECRKPKARVCWSNAPEGHFNECDAWLSPEKAQAWLDKGKSQFPKLEYWLENDAPSSGKWW